jgi:sortase A
VPAAPGARSARRRTPDARGALRALSTVLMVAGVLLLVDAGVTLAWQEPITALYTKLRQDSLAGDLRALERSGPTQLQLRALERLQSERQRIAFLARALEQSAHRGAAVGRIRIGRIGANFVLVNGTDGGSLRGGPGLYPSNPFPGAPGTVAIAGHRTTYLAPFRHIDSLRRGDTISLEMPYGKFIYRVEGTRIVKPTDVSVIRPVGYDRLVLSACHPLFSAAQRIIVFARLTLIVPRGSALRVGGPGASQPLTPGAPGLGAGPGLGSSPSPGGSVPGGGPPLTNAPLPGPG